MHGASESVRRIEKLAVVVTGLPASGKTTVAREVADKLGLVLLDKDEFLEDLYERFEVRSLDERGQLSRQSDHAFRSAAARSNSAVLVSHWRSLGDSDESGTPSDWLAQEYDRIVEVCCNCSPKVACARFLARTRHPSHLDTQIDANELAQRMASWVCRFPLGVGTLIEVSAECTLNSDALIEDIRLAFAER